MGYYCDTEGGSSGSPVLASSSNKVIALHQPVAIDLRFVVAVLKINNDLERIGDLAVNIADHAPRFAGKEQPECARSLPRIAELAQAMLRKSLDSVVNMDGKLARDVLEADDEVDDHYHELIAKLRAALREDGSRMDELLPLMADRKVLLDGAHNGAGAKALAAYLTEQEIDNVHWIVGVKADKNREEILAPLMPLAAAVYCVEPPVEEAVPAKQMRLAAERSGVAAIDFASIAEALHMARAAAGKNGVVLVAGSLFLVAAVRELIILEEDRPCDKSVC